MILQCSSCCGRCLSFPSLLLPFISSLLSPLRFPLPIFYFAHISLRFAECLCFLSSHPFYHFFLSLPSLRTCLKLFLQLLKYLFCKYKVLKLLWAHQASYSPWISLFTTHFILSPQASKYVTLFYLSIRVMFQVKTLRFREIKYFFS